jgi:hypothetical protein
MARICLNLRNFDQIAELAAESRKAAYQAPLERVIITDKDVPLVYDHSSVTEQRIREPVSELQREPQNHCGALGL